MIISCNTIRSIEEMTQTNIKNVLEPSPQVYEHIVCKFLLNLPKEEIDDPYRLSFHAQKAFYYYLDEIINDTDPKDWQKQKKDFFTKLKEHTPSFIKINPNTLSNKLLENKPVCGAIIFNKQNSKVLVIRVNHKYGFPKGKLNQGETLEECAMREVMEQTGIIIANRIDSRIRIEFDNHGGSIYFFVARGVSQYQRVKIDKKQIDEVIWMPIQQVRRDIQNRFVQRSKIAWVLYDRDFAKKPSEQYAPKYYKKDSQEFDYQLNPLLSFKFDRLKLQNAFTNPYANLFRGNNKND